MDDQERIARNDARFREANESILSTAAEYAVDTGLLPFICECASPDCTEIVQLSREEYERVRANPKWFINSPAHADDRRCRVVERAERYMVVEKLDRAGEVAEELDPRGRAEAG
ncbi:MAG: hypothetical protein QOE36_3370 [Gaiellaceae bacterium]|nr:hypothetical protein [Gaiellaceae bacterium]